MSALGEILKEAVRPFGDPHGKRMQIADQKFEDRQKSVFAGGEDTSRQLDALGTQADRLGGLRARAVRGIDTAEKRQGAAVRNAAGQQVQQQFGDQETGAVTHASALDAALKRAKTRVGIGQRGDAAIRNQQLKDRLEQVRMGIAGQARAISTQTAGQNIKAGVNLGVSDARDRISASRASAAGGIVGAVAGGIKGFRDRKAAAAPAADGTP